MGVSLVNSSNSDFLVPLIFLIILRQDLYLTQHAEGALGVAVYHSLLQPKSSSLPAVTVALDTCVSVSSCLPLLIPN